MAYTATITKNSVTKQGNLFNVSVDVVINDGTTDVVDTSVSARYIAGTSPSFVTAKLQSKIKDLWDTYIAEKAIYDAVALDTAITTLQSNLTAYINQ